MKIWKNFNFFDLCTFPHFLAKMFSLKNRYSVLKITFEQENENFEKFQFFRVLTSGGQNFGISSKKLFQSKIVILF